jgi:hypothetical protein
MLSTWLARAAIQLVAASTPTGPLGGASFDVAVYGATPAGIMAAVAAARMKKHVALLEPSAQHIGGMVSGGLSHTDIIRPSDLDNRLLVGGVAREFFELNTAWYANSTSRHRGGGGSMKQKPDDGAAAPIVWNVEPHVAAILFRRMLDAANVTVVLNAAIATATVSRRLGSGDDRPVIESIHDRSGRQFAAAMWVDASYEGDLLARAGVNFALGREPAAQYNESLAGFTGGSNPQFHPHIDPYDDDGALLPLVDSIPPDLAVGDGDDAVASYNFRLCITNSPNNRVPFQPPPRYNRSDWELVRRAAGGGVGYTGTSGGSERIGLGELVTSPPALLGPPPSKLDLNGGGLVGALGTDFVGTMHGSLPAREWAEANWTTRALMWQQHKDYVQGLLWFQQTEFGTHKQAHKGFGLCEDEFVNSSHWPPQLYVREARRMRGQRVVGQRDVVAQEDIGAEAVGLGGYVFDTHTARRYACTPGSPPGRAAQCTAPGGRGGDAPPGTPGYAWDESHMVSDPGLFQLPRSLLLPRRAEASNLVVPTAVSASHVAFSSMRMEPQWMVLGHAAGVLVALALGTSHTTLGVAVAVQDVPAAQLHATLRGQGAMLDLAALPAQSSSCVLNRCVPHNHTTAVSGHGPVAGCQFCKALAEDEWLVPVADFTPSDRSSANITALRKTTLRKALTPDAATDLHVDEGYSCGRAYLQHFRGVWICVVGSPAPAPAPSPAKGVWFAWIPMFNYSVGSLTITPNQPSSLLKRVWSVPSRKLPPKSVCHVAEARVLKLVKPATTIGSGSDKYYEVQLAAGQACPVLTSL